jgi:predicted metal-binding transcription factor (methanogenesis marker protein 9)
MKQTAFELFDEQLQEYIIAQDVVARKLIIEISFEEYMELKKQAKAMEKEQIEDAFDTGTTDEDRIGKEYYKETYLNDTGSR